MLSMVNLDTLNSKKNRVSIAISMPVLGIGKFGESIIFPSVFPQPALY